MQQQQQEVQQHRKEMAAVVQQTRLLLLVLPAVAMVASRHAAANAPAAAELVQGMLLGRNLHVAVRVRQRQQHLQQGWLPAVMAM
jgi:hypothetical protein